MAVRVPRAGCAHHAELPAERQRRPRALRPFAQFPLRQRLGETLSVRQQVEHVGLYVPVTHARV
eukprot:scaffold4427_cov417-Prasinococcus_capsulatus_cf.AAC.4